MLFFAMLQSKQHIAKEKKEIPTGTLTGHSDINNDKMVENLRQQKVGTLKREILEKRKLNGNVTTSIHKRKRKSEQFIFTKRYTISAGMRKRMN